MNSCHCRPLSRQVNTKTRQYEEKSIRRQINTKTSQYEDKSIQRHVNTKANQYEGKSIQRQVNMTMGHRWHWCMSEKKFLDNRWFTKIEHNRGMKLKFVKEQLEKYLLP